MKKKIWFAIVINLINTILSFLYLIICILAIIVVFVSFIWTSGHMNSYVAGVGVFATMLAVPLVVIFGIYPLLRIIALLNSIFALNRFNSHRSPKGFMITSGVFQILDAIYSFATEGLCMWIYTNVSLQDKITSLIGIQVSDYLSPAFSLLICVIVLIPIIVKCALEFISAILLFVSSKQKTYLNETHGAYYDTDDTSL